MTEQSDTETRLGPASAYAASEKELIWRYTSSAAAMNFHAQAYDFDQPHTGGFDADSAILRHLSDKRVDDLDKLSAVESTERWLQKSEPLYARVLTAAYTPRSWPDLLRIAMSLEGERGGATVTGLLPFSFVAQTVCGLRGRGKGLTDTFGDLASKPENARMLVAVRTELEWLLRHALAAYDGFRVQRAGHDRAVKLARHAYRTDRDLNTLARQAA